MKKKVMKGLPKRIAAFVMAVLMFFSLLPIDPSVVLAEEVEYSFSVKDKENQPIEDATLTFYNDNLDEVPIPDEGKTDANGEYVLTIDDTIEITKFTVSKDGYITTDNISLEGRNEVFLTKITTVNVTGSVKLPVEPEDGVTGAYADIKVSLLDEEENPVIVDEVEITADVDPDDGTYEFENVPVGNVYIINITSENNVYATENVSLDLTSVNGDSVNVNDGNGTQLVANKEVLISFDSESIFEVFVNGTTRTFEPIVKIGDELITEGYKITYSTEENGIVLVEDGNNLVVKAENGAPVGETIKVIATLVDEDGVGYVTTTKEIELEVKVKEPKPFDFVNTEITDDGVADVPYTTDSEYRYDASVNVEEVPQGDSITYSVQYEDIAEIDSNGQITIKKAGTTVVTVTYTAAANADYTTKEISFTLNVKEIEQTNNVTFKAPLDANGGELTYIFGENANTYNFEAESAEENVTITYSVTKDGVAAGAELVTIAGSDVTFLQAGTYVVTATASKENYIDKTVEYTVNITKADPEIYFTGTQIEPVINGKYLLDGFADFEEAVLASDVLAESDINTGVTYSTDSDLITVDSVTGEITFVNIKDASTDDVEITITATRAEDESYAEKTVSYTFKVVNWNPEGEGFSWDEIYELAGTTHNGWFTNVNEENPLTVSIKDGKTYAIFAEAPTNATVASSSTSFEVTDLDDGDNNEISFYIMDTSDANGYITGVHTVSGIKVDEITPSVSIKQEELTFIDRLLYFFSGEEAQKEFTVEVSETPETSLVTKYYYIPETDTTVPMSEVEYTALAESDWIEITDETEIKIPENSQKVIYAKVVDEAGHVSYAHTNGLITDTQAPTIELTPSDIPASQNGYYTEDFTVSVKVDDQENLSGIKEIVYWIGEKTGEGTVLETFAVEDDTTVSGLKYSHEEVLNIVAGNYNTKDRVTVYVQAVDNAGNVSEVEEVTCKVYIETPEISLTYDNNDVNNTNYYKADRTATIKINCREDIFALATKAVVVDDETYAAEWDESQSATVVFDTNGEHSIEVIFTNPINGNPITVTDSFWIDKDLPTGTATLVEVEGSVWTELLEKLTFGIWKQTTVNVEATATDATTSVETMQYFVSTESRILTENELESVVWQDYSAGENVSLTQEDIYAVYFKLTDLAGNVKYISTDGFVIDDTEAGITLEPEETNQAGFYNDDVTVGVLVKDLDAEAGINTTSGIKSITYIVTCDGVKTQEGTLYTFDKVNPEKGDLIDAGVFTGELTVKVDEDTNNSSNVVVTVYVEDNAGNTAESAPCTLNINATAPKFSIAYDNNDAKGNDEDGYFFTAGRTATITLIDEAYDNNAINDAIKVVLKDKNNNEVDEVENGVVISGWEADEADQSVHTATVEFTKDGYYTVEIDYANLAGVPNKEVTAVDGTVGALAFAIDSEAPTASISESTLDKVWNTFLSVITFGLYTKEDVTFTVATDDETSKNLTIEYLIYAEGKTKEQLDAITSWQPYDVTNGLTVTEEQQMSVYVKVTDQAGHVTYVNTDGIIVDKTPATITLPDFGNTIHKGDVEVNVDVTDAGVTSGIASVVYTVTSDGEETQAGTLDLTGGKITVGASQNNSDDVIVTVMVVDNAGNTTVETCELSINITAPTVGISYDNNTYVVDNTKYFFDELRTATITITDRADSFDATLATNAVKVVLKDKAGNEVTDNGVVISAWETEGNTHTATVKFTKDGYYTVDVDYTNLAGLSNESVTAANTEIAPFEFVIDTTDPVNVSVSALGKAWDEFLETITFGLYSKSDVELTIVGEDATSDIRIEYYISKDGSNKKVADLEQVDWTVYTGKFTVSEEQQMAVYVKVTDQAGNVTYVNSNGIVLDKTQAGIVLTPEAANAYDLYNDDVDVAITVDDAAITSGIKTVTYWITCDGTETKRETLYTFDITNPTKEDLKQTFEKVITVNAAENTGSAVVVTVEVVDNAGNVATKNCTLKINTIAPNVDISYDNNESTGHDGGLNYFFDELRTATITITDRADSFDAEAATNAIKVTLKDKAGNTVVEHGAVISGWTSNGNKHTATVAFTKDGYYTVEVEYTNKADLSNVDSEGNYIVTPSQDTVGGLAFVIDTTAPVDVTVSALTNTWEELLETITFGLYTAEDVVFTITGTDVMSNVTYEYYIANDGQAMTAQQLAQVADSLWTEYTESVTISKEQQMSIFVRVTDQAGNTTYVNSNGIVLDKTEAGITLTPEVPNTNGVYNSDVDIEIAVDDSEITSGIKSVEYWITKDGVETKRETLYTNTNLAPTKEELKQIYNGTITVDAMENNSSNVEVFVKVIDNAGNVNQDSVKLDIDMVAPTIEVSYDNNAYVDILNGIGYFNANRTATIVVTERTNHFDKDAFVNSVAITAKNFAGASVDTAVPVVEFVSTTEGATADEATHIFKVVFSADANYTLAISYVDKAGWVCSNDKVKYDEDSVTPQNFAIDITAPTGKITVGNLGFWETLLQSFTFGLWSPSDVNIIITAADVTSPIKTVEYYKTSTFTPMTETELKTVTDWVSGDKFTVSNDDIFVVYAKISDQTGNVRYISSNGIIVDETKPVFETYSPEVTITPQRPVNGIYDGNVTVDVGVIDPIVGGNSAYAGLRSIKYEVYNMGTKTQEGTLFNFTETNPAKDKLVQKWNGQDIVVDASKNNSNDVTVKITATDNAGNQTVATTTLKIDTTKPVIEVSYDNNNGDASFGDSVYYNANRVATIRVTERNFDASAVNVVITNTDGTVPTILGWTTTAGTGNGDDTVHTATIVYAADGDYTFAISAKDKVGNANSGVNYGNSQAPTAFTIDKTVPVISIAYDNNDFANENYYKADRTATISILEHNFDASRVVVTITATDNGQPVNAPAISNWSKSGDTYTATVNYNTDALYTFDISYSDKAQNEAADFAQQSFYVDKTMPQMSITEIVDQSANNKDKIGFVITATDTNFDVFTPVLTAVVKTETGFATKELNIASITDITNGRVYTISNIETDGIYRITCTLVDKAGNAYNAVTLHQADGTPYVEERTAEDTLVAFSVNRDGSTFEVDEATKEVLDNYYVYNVKEDIVIIEVNANQLTSNTVSLNGKELVEGTDYTIATEGGNGVWLRYSYSLNKDLFAEEGEYTIVVSSTDEAENNAFSDVKDMKVAFVVDRTAPVVTVSGLETDGKYQTDAQTVTLIPTDDGGAVKSIVVNQVDAEGNVIKSLLEELSGEVLEAALEENDGQISFVIPSGTYDYIEIVCADSSVNEAGSTNTVEILIEDVLITENELALIWATYQYAIIGGGAAVVAVPTGVVLFRRRLKLK